MRVDEETVCKELVFVGAWVFMHVCVHAPLSVCVCVHARVPISHALV